MYSPVLALSAAVMSDSSAALSFCFSVQAKKKEVTVAATTSRMQYFSKTLSLLVCSLFMSVNGVAAAPAPSAAPTVSIASGVIIGKSTTVTSGASTTSPVVNYLGVPFAAAPTGTLRFMPPVTPSSWEKPVMATGLPPSCLQQFTGGESVKEVFNNPFHAPPKESEDCLYLNVYAPIDASPTNKKPVMFWIFGGNFEFGSASLNYYNGSSFAAFQDIVVVTINYRTNIFGFPGSVELPAGKQNVGFLDQRLALDWVTANIAQFGGDPDQVTLVGESSGGYSIKQILANPPSPLPFRAAILESEAALTGQGDGFEEVATAFGCGFTPSPLACLQLVDASSIEAYITSADGMGVYFYPISDGITDEADVRPAIAAGRFADVPLLIGNNADEGRIFAALYGLDTAGVGETQVQSWLDATLDPLDSLAAEAGVDLEQTKEQILKAYDATTAAPVEVVGSMYTDYYFTCTVSLLSKYIATGGSSSNTSDSLIGNTTTPTLPPLSNLTSTPHPRSNPVYRYLYNASFPNQQIYPDTGAFHIAEVPTIFGTYDLQNRLGPATASQEGLSGFLQATWANFVKDPPTANAAGAAAAATAAAAVATKRGKQETKSRKGRDGMGWWQPIFGSAQQQQQQHEGDVMAEFGGRDPVGQTIVPVAATDGICVFWDPLLELAGF